MKEHQEKEEKKIENGDKVDRNGSDGTYSKSGGEELGAMPNDPAENAKKTSPEEDAGQKEDTRLSAGNS